MEFVASCFQNLHKKVTNFNFAIFQPYYGDILVDPTGVIGLYVGTSCIKGQLYALYQTIRYS